jgi:hypothetical protein
MTELRQVRAHYNADTITIYQAYNHVIADEALPLGTFGASFSRKRMTWIKPSFLWMMYRSGYGTKAGQERVLAIRISRSGLEWALRHSSLSHVDRSVDADLQARDEAKKMPVRVQWDPERDIRLQRLPWRSIQIGLSGEAVRRYTDDWIDGIDDVTELAHSVARLVTNGRSDDALALLPKEEPYPLPDDIAKRIGATEIAR